MQCECTPDLSQCLETWSHEPTQSSDAALPQLSSPRTMLCRIRSHHYLQIPVNEPVGFKIVIVLSEWVDELFSHLRIESTWQGFRSPPLQESNLQCRWDSKCPRTRPGKYISATFLLPTSSREGIKKGRVAAMWLLGQLVLMYTFAAYYFTL